MVTDYKKDLMQAYNANANEREKQDIPEWKIPLRESFLKLVVEEKKKTLLEIGAGSGKDSKFFVEHNLQVTAIDLSGEMVKLCLDKGLEAYVHDFYNLVELKRKFDAVWAMNCLLHVEKSNLESVLSEISNIVNPTGLFFMGVYGGEDKEGIWEEDMYIPKRFFSFYTDDNIRTIVNKYFDIINFERVETGGQFYQQAITLRKK